MRAFLFIAAVCLLPSASAQSTPAQFTAQQMLATTRALYDAPFSRGLVTFDCSVRFDWQEHYISVLGEVPPAAQAAIRVLKTIGHRVVVDHNSATVSPVHAVADLDAVPHAEELEKVFTSMVANGLNAWLPFATNVILPVGQTPYTVETLPTGYKLSLSGQGVQAQLVLASDFRLTSGVAQQPQPVRFETSFERGPQGFLLTSVRTGDTTDSELDQRATFTYSYEPVQGLHLPTHVTVTPARTEIWQYDLNDCKVVKNISVEALPPAS